MLENSISLESLLETHELPFVIIDASLTIVGLNRAWEQRFGVSRTECIGQPCCEMAPDCRHHELFQKLEPYESTEILHQNTQLRVRGYPLLDKDGTVYLGESITQVTVLQNTPDTSRMIGNSTAFLSFQKKLLRAAQSRAPVLLMGETGTGKELAAEFIHNHSRQAEQAFVVVDCTVLSEDLFESELFGHEKGSFTGAASAKKGLFELGDQGSLFFDEIGELPLTQQPKLLRALETGQFRRVGGTTPLKSDVRIICATNRNLSEMVKTGTFREDLYYRLLVFPILVPALRERLQDMLDLTRYLLKQLSQRDGHNYSIDKAALIKLLKHQWPGNIRELKNCLQLAGSLCHNDHISEEDITYIQQQDPGMLHHPNATPDFGSNKNTNPLIQMESEVIRGLLKKYQGNRKLIASEMDISERTLYRKLKRFELN
jgi:transcriptional regulator with PAS, ATPase and Fis domain